MKKAIIGMGLMFAASQAAAFDASQLYYGGGLGSNSIDYSDPVAAFWPGGSSDVDDAMGYQVFAGIPLGFELGGASTAVEVGYMDTGDFDITVTLPPFPTASAGSISGAGVWVNGVASWPVGNAGKVIGRLGMDFGDDDGFMFGAGYGHGLSDNMDIRVEYVARDSIDSIQLNVVYRP